MSAVENFTNNQEKIQAEVIRMQEAIALCDTGADMLEHSQFLAASDEMEALMYIIGDENIPEKERIMLAKYMGDALKYKPTDGLQDYATYLEESAENPDYAARKDYYESLAYAARALHKSDIFQEYIKTYEAFQSDDCEEAVEARKITEEVQGIMKELS